MVQFENRFFRQKKRSSFLFFSCFTLYLLEKWLDFYKFAF